MSDRSNEQTLTMLTLVEQITGFGRAATKPVERDDTPRADAIRWMAPEVCASEPVGLGAVVCLWTYLRECVHE